MVGIAVLIVGQWNMGGAEQNLGILLGLGSGVSYAGVAVYLRMLRSHDPMWMSALNHLWAALTLLVGALSAVGVGALAPDALWPPPEVSRLVVLVLFGVLQMALPYVLFGMGLRYVSPQEAGILTLTEPLLNPLWTYLRAGERPAASSVAGGGILVAMLLLRYIPAREKNGR